MINTLQIKQGQFATGTYKTGSGSEVILIIGSCRSVPYLTYLKDWNNQNGNRFTIHFLDPFNWNWDMQEQRVDYLQALAQQETNENLLNVLRSTTIFIHEFYANAGMFNCDKNAEKNIYQFGLNPSMDICVPNFNDIFILTRDIVSFDMNIRKMATQDYNVNGKLSTQTLSEIETVRNNNLERFYNICSKTDTPEFSEYFKNNYKKMRLFWTFNHISKNFTKQIWYYINDKFLNLKPYTLTEVDLYANNYTFVCEYDDVNWGEEIKTLKEIL